MEKVKWYLEELQNITGAERIALRTEFHAYWAGLTESEKAASQPLITTRKQEISNKIDTIAYTVELLQKGKVVYEGTEYELGEWVTLADYCRLYNLKISRLTNWLKRGIIPAENVVTIPALNNLKLLRNEPYRLVF